MDPQAPITDAALQRDEEPVVLPKRRVSEDVDMDITPMIDITFLLLIFFLVSSRLDVKLPVELPKARHGTAVALRSSIILTLGKGPDGSAIVYFGDGKVDDKKIKASNVAEQEVEIAKFIDQQLKEDAVKESILIKAERGVKHREEARVRQAIGTVKEVHRRNIQVHIAVLEVE